MTGPPPAVLVLEDGWVARGTAFGAASPVAAAATAFGEMVFNTGMTGYQETLTDPSYHRQIVAMTAPHIGNTGINDEDHESRRIWVAGYVVRELARIASSWRAIRSLDDELRAQGVIGIAVTGTRALTRHLRDKGAMRAAISTAPGDVADPRALIDRVLASPSMAGADLAREVSTPQPYVVRPPSGTATRYRVAAVDLGIKAATPRKMAERGCEVHVLPATVTAAEIMDIRPDGVFFSNGPGDPAAAGYAVEAMRGVLEQRLPVFGICLGSQILGRALGLGTYKLLFGHRGVNQPVLDLATGRVHITSHNHGFAVAPPGATAAGGSRDGSCAGETSDAGLPRRPIVPDERVVSEGAGCRRGVSFADGGRESSVSHETAGGERGVSHGGNGGRQGDVRHGSHRGVSGGARGGQEKHVTSRPCGGEQRAGNRDANGGQEGNVSVSRGAGGSRETAEADGANEAGVVPAGMMPSAQPFRTCYGRAHVSHACLNDGVVEGLRLLDRPAFGVQYHPEAAPGPHDAAGLFDRFTELMDGGR